MARILTGIQSTGTPHFGNIMGAIKPMIEMSNKPENDAFAFVADLHSLTTIKNAATMKSNTLSVAACWIACGFDYEKNTIYLQSHIPQITELTWYLNCFTPYPMLANAHSFKDKSEKLSDVNAGLFTYPVLMAADIIGYDANFVPVGKDQIQHLEITRDIASNFNRIMGDTFVIPEAKVSEDVKIIPGTDGQKMSKSYHNFIDIFLPEKELKKQVMSIQTDSTPLEEPKNPDTCNVYQLYKIIATEEQKLVMRENYAKGGYGYGHAKNELLGILLSYFANEREEYNKLITNEKLLNEVLAIGAKKASKVLNDVLKRVKDKVGYYSI